MFMTPLIIFWISFGFMLFAIIYFDKKYCMLRDISTATPHQPYSWARVQLAWWTIIVLSSFISIVYINGDAPGLSQSTVILLGISAATTATARVIDLADEEKPGGIRHQNDFGKNFFLDILSDQTGVSVHRFQTIIFNATFGVWFITEVLNHLPIECKDQECLDAIMPGISSNNLILLGLSSATYAALKITENKSATLTARQENNNGQPIETDESVG